MLRLEVLKAVMAKEAKAAVSMDVAKEESMKENAENMQKVAKVTRKAKVTKVVKVAKAVMVDQAQLPL